MSQQVASRAGTPKGQIDRRTFARERARGASYFEALRRAGSRVRSPNGASSLGRRLEQDVEVLAMINEEKKAVAVELDDLHAKALAELERILENDEAKDSDKLRAASEVFKLAGSYAAEKRTYSGPDGGPIETITVARHGPQSEEGRRDWLASVAAAVKDTEVQRQDRNGGAHD